MSESEEMYYGSEDVREVTRDTGQAMYIEAGKRQRSRECVTKILSGRHILVVGETGSGKTYYMSKICEMLPTLIFINPQEEVIVDKITQVVTDEEDKVMELLEDGYRKIQFLPSEDDDIAIDQLKTIRLDLWNIASEMNIKDGEFWMNMIVDEANIFAQLGSRTDAQNLARRGRRYGVRSWFLTQQPQDLAKGIVNNTTHAVIFQLGTFAEPYYQKFHIPIEEEREWIARPYHYVIWDKHVLTRCHPI